MKNFIKMTLATVTGIIVCSVLSIFILTAVITAVSSGSETPVVPDNCFLEIDMSTFVLAEQNKEADPFAAIQSGEQIPSTIGILNAIRTVNTAATDPRIKFLLLKPDQAQGGLSHIEEFRTALENFRNNGKAIISYIETPTNAGYYLASASDKIYMGGYDGSMNLLTGASSQMIFLKDLLDKLGINVQLIRHGKYKSAGEMFVRSSSSKENLEQNQVLIDSIWESMASRMAAARGISTDELNDLIDNLDLNFAEDFLAEGLVDELVTRETLEEKLCALYGTESYSNVKSMTFIPYSKTIQSFDLRKKDKIAIIYADGQIVDGKAKKEVAGDRFAGIIYDIRKDTTIKAVVLRVNSPGGSVTASAKIKHELDLLRESVPVIASYGNYAASGGYWISANTDKIFSNETTLTGSIGVFSMIPDVSKTLKDKIHVNITSVNSNRHGDMYSLISPLDAAETAYMQASVEKIYDRFTTIVSEGRNMPVSEVDAIAQGRVWSGKDALGIGLVDQTGTIEDALNYAAGLIDGVSSIDQVQILSYPKPQTSLEALMESFGAEKTALSGTPFEHIAASFGKWDESQAGKVYARLPYEINVK